MSETTSRSDGTTTITGPADQEWFTLVIAGEEQTPISLDKDAPMLITLVTRQGVDPENQAGETGGDTTEFATLTVNDDVTVTVDGVELSSIETLTRLEIGIKQALTEALNRVPGTL